jgi:fatty acid desaturase
MSTEGPTDPRLHRLLLDELTAAGCFRRAPLRSALYAAAIAGTYAAAYALLLAAPPLPVRVLGCIVLAFLCVQAAFLAHEAGHGAITRDRRLSICIGQLSSTLLTGLSYSYYRHVHRAHHRYTNERERDPDMQSGLFGLYPESAAAKRGFARHVARHQSVLIWILVWLQGLTFKLHSLRYLAANPRATRGDQLVLVAHYAMWLAIPVTVLGPADALCNYGVMTLFIGGYTGALFLVNHIGTRVIGPHESLPFALHEIAVTRNLGTSLFEQFAFGGLNNHIEHHLFPSMPTARLRAARAITRDFCRGHGIAYRETSWLAAVRDVNRHFREMSARVPA